MVNELKAIIFDVDGTLADTERLGHRVAFNQTFAELGLDWHWEEDLYGKLLRITGGKERLKFYIDNYLDATKLTNIDEFIAKIHANKTEHYVKLVQSGKLPLRAGIKELLISALENKIKIAIATTTTWSNVESLLTSQLGTDSLNWFAVIAAGDIVKHKKPAPDIYLHALDKLKIAPQNCIAVEDSRNGLLSSTTAGLKTVVITNGYTKDENLAEAALVVDTIGSKTLPFNVIRGNSFSETSVNLSLLQKIIN